MKIKKLTAYLLMSGMILGTMSSDLYTIKAQAVETIEETEDKTPENEVSYPLFLLLFLQPAL